MGLPVKALKILAPHLRNAKILCLGYPDLIATPENIETIFGVTPIKFTDNNSKHGVGFPLPETIDVFEKIGSQVLCVDVVANMGIETIADLNESHDFGKFDLVIDPGTLEHCFNIGQAMMTAANAVRAGGRIFHISPMNMMNHGFYNICPTMMQDFYTQNDWEVLMIEQVSANNMRFNAKDRFYGFSESVIYSFARRKTEAALRFPIQGKYLKHIESMKVA